MQDEDETDSDIVAEAKRRFDYALEWESVFRSLFKEDIRFAIGDSDNGYQWDNSMRNSRELDRRPCLTINKTRQHCLQIINEAKKNKPSVKIKATGDGATYESAQIYDGIVRHIEYISNAQQAYDTATEFQVQGGIGYWRVTSDYAHDDSFDQEIFIRRIKNPLSVALDPDIKEADGSDMKFGFIFDDIKKEDFDYKYPKYKDIVGTNTLSAPDNWLTKDHVRVAEYYRCVHTMDYLIAIDMPDGQTQIARESELPEEIKAIVKKGSFQKRPIEQYRVEWYLIAGDVIVDRSIWPGSTIPIVRVIGEETVIDGLLHRAGHVRALKDPQRMFNYATSSAVEYISLQGKQPYLASVESIEGLEDYWASANTVNHAYLPYNGLDEQGNAIAKPDRTQPPTMAQAYVQWQQMTAEEMKMVSGQYDPAMGKSNEDMSGVAIQQWRQQSDTASYHFIDNQAKAIRYTGKILIDVIPKFYDTKRVIRILAEDGTDTQVTVDPNHPEALGEKHKDTEEQEVEQIFNPNVGKYEVVADVGPAFQTKRQEAFAILSNMSSQNPKFMDLAGDLMFKAADFPYADELAERMNRTMDPAIKGDGPTPQVQQLQQQLDQAHQLLQMAQQELGQMNTKLQAKTSAEEVDEYKAVTDRLKVIFPTLTPQELDLVVRKSLIDDAKARIDGQNLDNQPVMQ